jgi:Nucleotidyl transferase AbiEii toxin, Type IV TA system
VTKGLAQSVQTRLVHHAHAIGVDPNLVLARYAAERLLYRLSCSGYAYRFVLKGALMLLVWLGETIRPTRDVDLLGSGAMDPESLREIFTEICALPVEPDGLAFDGASVRVAAIRFEEAARRRHVCRSSANRRRPPGAVQPRLAAWRAVALTMPPAESPVSTRASHLMSR